MRSESFQAKTLISLFRRYKIATMPQMKVALGTTADMTVFRKLRELDYRSSYSHSGKFYTLDALAEFDDRGVWTCKEAHFSRFGSLIETIEQFVTRSDRGFSVSELASELSVQVKDPLLKLVKTKRLSRESIFDQYVYFAVNVTKRKDQLYQRQSPVNAENLAVFRDSSMEASDETKATIILFFSTLDERQRRLYAGLESLRLGYGGDNRIAELIGLDAHTVARGRKELLERDVEIDRVRQPGAGRTSVEKKRQKLSKRSRG